MRMEAGVPGVGHLDIPVEALKSPPASIRPDRLLVTAVSQQLSRRHWPKFLAEHTYVSPGLPETASVAPLSD